MQCIFSFVWARLGFFLKKWPYLKPENHRPSDIHHFGSPTISWLGAVPISHPTSEAVRLDVQGGKILCFFRHSSGRLAKCFVEFVQFVQSNLHAWLDFVGMSRPSLDLEWSKTVFFSSQMTHPWERSYSTYIDLIPQKWPNRLWICSNIVHIWIHLYIRAIHVVTCSLHLWQVLVGSRKGSGP